MNIEDRLSKIAFFNVTPDISSLKPNEAEALKHCVAAGRVMTDLFLEQAYSENHQILSQLRKREDPEGQNLLKYFLIHGGPWDSFNHNEPFIQGIGSKPKFGSFYPSHFTKEEYENWLAANPQDREMFESPVTVIRRLDRKLISFPYSKVYRSYLEQASQYLQDASKNLDEGVLKQFLKHRADAFLTNNYWDSDLAWIDTTGNPFEVTVGPYETYFDRLFGLKSAYTTFLGIPDKQATRELSRFSPAVPKFDELLSEEFSFKPKSAAIPLEVVSDVFRGGDAAFGYVFVAYNLPNDRRIHEIKGSKKVFSATMMQAKFEQLARPIAERIFSAQDLDNCEFKHRLLFVLGHELAHGIGPNTKTLLGDINSSLEEAKANMLGAKMLGYFTELGLMDTQTLAGCINSKVAASFYAWQTGFTEAHAKGDLLEYNWIKDKGGLRFNIKQGILEIDHDKVFKAMSALSSEFIKLQQAGDYSKAKAFMDHWGRVAPEIPQILKKMEDLPLSVQPVYNI